MKKIIIALLVFHVFTIKGLCQDDSLFAELDMMVPDEKQEVIATFKSNRIILSPSTERSRRSQLQFRISHLFTSINSGVNNLFGLDHLTNMNLIFDYGLTDNIQLGLARSNKSDKSLMPNVKVGIIRQSTGKKSFPFSVSYFGNIDIKTTKYQDAERNSYFPGRLSYISSVLISRKFNRRLSLQLSPVYLHRNLVETREDLNDLYSIGFAGRFMLNDHISFNWEYFYTYPSTSIVRWNNNPLSVGFDIETGGHVFQLFFTNAAEVQPGKFLTNENPDFFKGNIQFGFSILREFNL